MLPYPTNRQICIEMALKFRGISIDLKWHSYSEGVSIEFHAIINFYFHARMNLYSHEISMLLPNCFEAVLRTRIDIAIGERS